MRRFVGPPNFACMAFFAFVVVYQVFFFFDSVADSESFDLKELPPWDDTRVTP
jgi:hypothetical protein